MHTIAEFFSMSFFVLGIFIGNKSRILKRKNIEFFSEFTFLVLLKGGDLLRSEWKPKGEIVHLLAALRPENRLACEISLITGLRINDVLSLKTSDVARRRFSIREEKTGKVRSITLPKDIVERCMNCCGTHYVFEHRLNGRKHRTRQAVFKDLKRVAEAFNVKENVTPHSLRKVYAVDEFEKCGDLRRVQRLLNHSDEAVTMLYALANVVGKNKNFKLRKNVKFDKSK